MKMRVIEQEKRVYWDLFVFTIIVIATFEIPYELLVDIKNPKIELFFDYLFLVVFSIDILLNLVSTHEIKNNGILGIRKVLPPKYRFSSSNDNGSCCVRSFPATMVTYLTSWWFVIDFLAVFPFEMVFSGYAALNMSRSARLLRLSRLLRVFRALRAIKAVKAFHSIDRVFHLNPSLGRFVIICVVVPWLLHVFACLLSYFESVPGGLGFSYAESLEHLFVTFTTNNRAAFSTLGGKVTATSAVIFGYIFFGLLMGNFASFFESIDSQKALLEDKKKQWKVIFKSYPDIFDRGIQKRVMLSVKNNLNVDVNNELSMLVQSLDAELEMEIKARLGQPDTNI